jgi:hypothetical protein
MSGVEFIKLYNQLVAFMVAGEFRPKFGQFRGGMLRFIPARIKEAEEQAAWLEDNEFCIPMYLSGAFGAHNWCYQPQLKKLQNKRYIRAYNDGSAAFWYEITSRSLGLPLIELRPSEELVKKRLQQEGKTKLCMVHADTGGFNSRSPVCQGCSNREACKNVRRAL